MELSYSALSNRYKSEFTVVNTQNSKIDFEIKEGHQLDFKPRKGTLAPNESAAIKVILRMEAYDTLNSPRLDNIQVDLTFDVHGDQNKKTSKPNEQHVLKAILTEDAFLHLKTDITSLKYPQETKPCKPNKCMDVLRSIREIMPKFHLLKMFCLAAVVTSFLYFDLCLNWEEMRVLLYEFLYSGFFDVTILLANTIFLSSSSD